MRAAATWIGALYVMVCFAATFASTIRARSQICNDQSSSACFQRLHIALHAQAHSSSDKFVVGSEMTCRGFSKAFKDQGHYVQMMYPGNYSSIADQVWDIVFIEGWFPAIAAFIHEIRRLSRGHAKVYFFCLDPDFPGLDVVQELDVDAFFTNSNDAIHVLKAHAPHSEVMLLAAESPPSATSHRPSRALGVVYVGNVIGINSKRDLAAMLREAIPFGLTIFGYAWDLVPEFAPYWGGILPPEDLPDVYASARVVLGATMDGQRTSGMINNRVFEVLAAGAILINDHYDALELLMGDHILYYNQPGDVTRHLHGLATFPHSPVELQSFVSASHTYDDRARQIVAAHSRLPAGHSCANRLHCPKLVVVLDESVISSSFLVNLYLQDVVTPALNKLRDDYHVRFATSVSDVAAMTDLTFHDFVLALSCWNCPVDVGLRQRISKSFVAGKGLYFLRPPQSASEGLAFYDVLFYTSPADDEVLSAVRTNRQHAFGLPSRPHPSSRPSAHPTCEWMAVGDWTDDSQRLVHVLTGLSTDSDATGIVVFPEQSRQALTHTIAYLNSTQPRLSVQFATTPTLVLEMLVGTFQCKALYLPAADDAGGGDWVVAVAATLGLTLHVQPDTFRWPSLFKHVLDSTWDVEYVANGFRLGMTQRLCLGHGGASVRMVWPVDRAAVGDTFEVSFETAQFDIPRDGCVCVFVDGQVQGCLMRPNLRFSVVWPEQRGNGTLVLELGLRSNIYGNDFAKTSPITVVHADQQASEVAVDPIMRSGDELPRGFHERHEGGKRHD